MQALHERRFVHYSCERVGKIESRPTQKAGHKPAGLWISPVGVKHGWIDFCRNAEFRWPKDFRWVMTLSLRPDAKVLHLAGHEDILNFTERYGNFTKRHGGPQSVYEIRWPEVALTYQGIVIAPYVWSARHVAWYYGWDCASGCIWDVSAIKRTYRRRNTPVKQKGNGGMTCANCEREITRPFDNDLDLPLCSEYCWNDFNLGQGGPCGQYLKWMRDDYLGSLGGEE